MHASLDAWQDCAHLGEGLTIWGVLGWGTQCGFLPPVLFCASPTRSAQCQHPSIHLQIRVAGGEAQKRSCKCQRTLAWGLTRMKLSGLWSDALILKTTSNRQGAVVKMAADSFIGLWAEEQRNSNRRQSPTASISPICSLQPSSTLSRHVIPAMQSQEQKSNKSLYVGKEVDSLGTPTTSPLFYAIASMCSNASQEMPQKKRSCNAPYINPSSFN